MWLLAFAVLGQRDHGCPKDRNYTPTYIATVSKEKERCPAFHVAAEQLPIF